MPNTHRIEIAVDESPKTINFSALTDLNGVALATTYASAPRVLSIETADQLVQGKTFNASTSTTQLRILASLMGDPLPINVIVTILAGADIATAPAGTLLYIRTQLINQTGRFDLGIDVPNGDYSDNGADYHIRAGQRILDLMQDHPRTIATYQKDIASGDHTVVFKYNRSVEKVWVTAGGTTDDTGRNPLTKIDYDWLKREYAAPVASLTAGRPIRYARGIIGLAPEQIGLTIVGGANPYTDDFTYDSEDIEFGQDNLDKTGVVFYPPSDGTYTMVVKGRWFSRPLISNTDKSFWSVNYDDALVLASMLSIEKSRRNFQGVNDMRSAISDILLGIDKDMSGDEIAEVDFLEEVLYPRV